MGIETHHLHHPLDTDTVRHLNEGKEVTELLAYTVAGGMSFLAVMTLFLVLAVSSMRAASSGEGGPQFMRTKVGIYFFFLLVCDFIQAAGSLMDIEWIIDAKVRAGSHCTAQAIFYQIGNVGSALWSLAIAFHTFALLFLQIRISDVTSIVTMILVWLLTVLLVIIGPVVIEEETKGPFHGISGSWCWITDEYQAARIGLEYFWMFFSALCSFVLYTLVFLRLRGNFVGQGRTIRFRFVDQSDSWVSSRSRSTDSSTTKLAKQMLWYPVAYTVVLLPMAICRWTEFAGGKVSYAVNLVTGCLFGMTGFVNVLLFTSTRRVIPKRPSHPTTKSSRDIVSTTISGPFHQKFGNHNSCSSSSPMTVSTSNFQFNMPRSNDHASFKSFRRHCPGTPPPHQRTDSNTSNASSESRFSTDTDDDDSANLRCRKKKNPKSGYLIHPFPVTLRPIPTVITTPPTPSPSQSTVPSESTISVPDLEVYMVSSGDGTVFGMPALTRF